VATPALAATSPGPDAPAKVPAGSVNQGAKLHLAAAAAPVAFTGAVKDPSGRAMSGATITLVAWPTDAELAKLRPGDPVPMTRIGITTADSSGRYSLALDQAAVKQWIAARPASSAINVELAATTDTAAAVAATTLMVDGASTASGATSFAASESSAVTVSPRSPVPLSNFTTAMASGTWAPSAPSASGAVGIDLITKVMATTPAAKTTGASVSADASVSAAASAVCGTYQKSLGDQKVTLAEISGNHSAWSVKYAYTAAQSSTLGFGISATGGSGTYSVGGTAASSTTAGLNFNETGGIYGSMMFRTWWQYGQYYEDFCSPRNVFYYTARPVQWHGAALTETGRDIFNASHCVPISSGNGVTIANTTETTMSGGVNIASMIGINLSAQTGFKSTSELIVTLKRAGSLCGSKAVWNMNDAGALTVK
jgi:hypothetical protein